MASGDTLFKFFAQDNQPPATNFATPDTFAAVTGDRHVLDFAGAGADETAIMEDWWPSHYDGGGVDVVVDYSTDGTVTAAIQFEISFEKIIDGSDQDAAGVDFDQTPVKDITDTPSAATANINDRTAALAVTHAECGSPAVGDRMRFKITRDFNHAVNADDVQLHAVYITET